MGKKKTKNKSSEIIQANKKPCLNNILVTIVVFLLIFTAYKTTPSYKWVFDSLARYNLEIINKNPNLHIDRKYEAKLGFDYKFINYVKSRTPENAVILIPPRSEFLKKNFNKKGFWGVKSKIWSTYFLYPRVIVDQKTIENDSSVVEKITHVMIINGWGYDKLEYSLREKYEYNVLPIKLSGAKK